MLEQHETSADSFGASGNLSVLEAENAFAPSAEPSGNSLQDLLPEGFAEDLITPEIKTFCIDRVEGNGLLVVTGDVSHHNRADNPIVELFRTVEQAYREKANKPLAFTPGCPFYNAATNTTHCHFYPNNQKGWGSSRLQRKMEPVFLHEIGPEFKELLRGFFASEEFKDYLTSLTLLDHTGDDKDKIDWLRDACNNSIKEFIKSRGYKLPEHRLVYKTSLEELSIGAEFASGGNREAKAASKLLSYATVYASSITYSSQNPVL